MDLSPDQFHSLDQIGAWSELKLEILKRYANEYAKILSSQEKKGTRLKYYYIDGFAGAGVHRAKADDALIPGSPARALAVEPKFDGYCFIEMDPRKVELLDRLAPGRSDVRLYEGDCNQILLERVLPTIKYGEYRRALCLLDPYGLQLKWEVMKLAGKMETIDLFLNFPIMDMNRNTLWRDANRVTEEMKRRMDFFWGDRSWESVAWETETDLFQHPTKRTNDAIVEAFRDRLRKVAGFRHVPKPLPMRLNVSDGPIIYYLFFASHNRAGADIATHLFESYERYTG